MARWFYEERKIGTDRWAPCRSTCSVAPVPARGFEFRAAPERVPVTDYHLTLTQLRRKHGGDTAPVSDAEQAVTP